MVLVVFRFKCQPNVDMAAFEELGGRLYASVSQIPGFLGIKDYQSADGEIVNIVEFASEEAVQVWKTHPEHLIAKQRAKEFMSEYKVQICEVRSTIG